VLARLECNASEASEELPVTTRGGFVASAGFTPLHYACERRPPIEVVQAFIEASPEALTRKLMPGGCLPLHIACTWHASSVVVSALLSAEPAAAGVPDELGNIPLHSACFSGALAPIVDALLRSFPKGVLARNNQGSLPIDICKRLRHENRKSIMALLSTRKDEVVLSSHQRTRASDSLSPRLQPLTLSER
jgi:ankyrin repeat protein